MTAFPRPFGATVLIAAAALVLAGCASADTAPVADSPPASSAPAQPGTDDAATDSEESSESEDAGAGDDSAADEPTTDEPTAQAGAYVDYREGIIAETSGTKALFFHAAWCPQCRALEESILSGEIPDDLTIIKADYDTEIGLRQQYGVTLQTTIVYVDDEGEALSSTVLYSDTTLDALVAAAP